MAGVTIPGNSAYTVSKIAAHKYMEYVAAGELSVPLFLIIHEISNAVARLPNAPTVHGTPWHCAVRDQHRYTGDFALR